MVKIRKIASIERGIEEILQALSDQEIQETIGKGSSYLRKCSDPDRDSEGRDSEGVKRNIDHIESVEHNYRVMKTNFWLKKQTL